MKQIIGLLTTIITGDSAPIGYVLGIGFSVLGIILATNVEKTSHFIGTLFLCLIGIFILFLRVRQDIIDIRNDRNI